MALSAALMAVAGQGASAAVVTAPVAGSPAQIRAYWTPERMRTATPLDLVLDTAGQLQRAPMTTSSRATDVSDSSTTFPDRAHGKVFFTLTGGSQPGDYVCSGTVVESNSHSLVWTAGHCVDDAESGGGFASNWIFVPGYRAGGKPYGEWPARQLQTTDGWRTAANSRVDFGAVTVARDSDGRGVQDVVGARGIAFGQPRPHAVTAFGYPAEPTLFEPLFDGERLYSCDSTITASDNPPGNGPLTMQIDCDMSGGSSGGGWVGADGNVVGLTSYGYAADFDHLYGPYFGATGRDLYDQASGPAVKCASLAVTNLGGGGKDTFTGALGTQSFRLGGGSDRASASAGNDALCGGAGRDVLVGGPGHDVCVGGPGHDRARGCEVVRSVP